MFDRLKNSIGYFVDCIRLVAWANSDKPFVPPTIEIELNFLAGYSQRFEVAETPNAIEYQGKIFVVASEDRELYQELSIVPLHWIDANLERINRLEHCRAEAEAFRIETPENMRQFMSDYRALSEEMKGDRVDIDPIGQAPNVKGSGIKPNTLEAVNAYLSAIDRPHVSSLDEFSSEVNVMSVEGLGELVDNFNADLDKFAEDVKEAQHKPASGNILANSSTRKAPIVNFSHYQLSPEDAALFKTKHIHKKHN